MLSSVGRRVSRVTLTLALTQSVLAACELAYCDPCANDHLTAHCRIPQLAFFVAAAQAYKSRVFMGEPLPELSRRCCVLIDRSTFANWPELDIDGEWVITPNISANGRLIADIAAVGFPLR